VIAEEAADEEEADYEEYCCSNCFSSSSASVLSQILKPKTEGRGDSPAAEIPIILVVLLCLLEVATTPFAPVPPPLSTVPLLVPVFVPVFPPVPGSPTPELEGSLSGAAVKDVRSVV
jgi:hypothetical protein